MDLHEQELRQHLAGRRIGGRVHFFDEVDSTNELAFRLAVDGAPEGTVVVADAQRGGKGRMKRRWESPPGCNLYTSIILRPRLRPAVAAQVTLVAGVALADFLSRYCPGYVSLKWPNDVLIRGRKVCGILTEMKAVAGETEFIVAGIGVNINMGRNAFDEPILSAATSLAVETGRDVSRLDFAVGLYGSLERFYGIFLAEGFGPVREIWLRYAAWMGKRIRVVFANEVLEGEMADMDGEGALLVREANGAVTRVLAGDASLREG